MHEKDLVRVALGKLRVYTRGQLSTSSSLKLRQKYIALSYFNEIEKGDVYNNFVVTCHKRL